MSGVRNDGLWITNDPGGGGGGQTRGGAIAAGGIGGAVAAAKDLLFGEKSEAEKQRDAAAWVEREQEAQASRAQQQAKSDETQRKKEKNERIDSFRRFARLVPSDDKLNQKVREEAQADGTLSRRVFVRASRYISGASQRKFYGQDAETMARRYGEMVRDLPLRLSDFKWRGPDGSLSDHGIVDPAELDLGYGGAYAFNQVWDESLPHYKRSPISHFHKRIADIYAISAQEAALAVVAEYANPGCAEGLGQFRAPTWIATTDHSRAHYHSADVYVQDYSVINIMHATLKALRERGPIFNCRSTEAALRAVTQEIQRDQGSRMETVMLAAYRDTRDVILGRAHSVWQNAMVKTERGVEDFNFAHDQYIKISDACAREDLARLRRCAESISGETEQAAEDAAVLGGTQAVFRRADAQSLAIIGVTGGHRVIRAARKSPACRDALEAYRDRACMNRVLPHGAVRVDVNPQGTVYGAPEEDRS